MADALTATRASRTAAAPASSTEAGSPRRSRPTRVATGESPGVRWLLRVLAIGYVFMLVAWPTWMVAQNTFMPCQRLWA